MRGGGTVWLVGLMGAGKSAAGAALARRLGRPFVDTDAEVERSAGASVAALFASEGEAGFRRRERAAFEALGGKACVVALGGGAPCQPGAAERLAETGTMVWLRARPETLAARVGAGADRPLLAGTDAEERVRRLGALLAERAPHYARAPVQVETDGLSPEAVAEAVARELEAACG